MEDIVATRLKNSIKKQQITKQNAKILKEFDQYNKANKLAESTRLTQIQIMILFASTVNIDFKRMTKKDIIRYFSEVKYSDYTANMVKIVVRKFFKWLNGGEEL